MLYEVLGGLPPCDDGESEDIDDIMARTITGEIDPLPENQEIPESLNKIAMKALAQEPHNRYATAKEFANELNDYLEGAKRRQRALELLEQATSKSANSVRLRKRADAIRESALEIDDEEELEPMPVVWKREEQASRLDHGADTLDVVVTQLASAALAQFPDLPQAHELLSEHYSRAHSIAESRGNNSAAERNRMLLNAHDTGRFAGYLKGDGAVSLVTEPAGAQVEIFRYVETERRFVAEAYRTGALTTPIASHPLPMGSYLLVISHPERRTVRYPVQIGREQHWDGIPPGETEPQAIYLPLPEELTDSEVYVPSGWMIYGAEDQPGSLKRGRAWVDGFVIMRHPTKHRDYLGFIESLVKLGREDDANRFAPQTAGLQGSAGLLVYERDRHNQFALAEGWSPDAPVMLVNWHAARAFAMHRTIDEGQRWRLPHELEWAKAARGVDGRPYPWGTALDPSWCAMRESADWPGYVDTFRDDESPYGVQGLGGNVRDWCLNLVSSRPPIAPDSRLVVVDERTTDEATSEYRGVRGGGWTSTTDDCRSNLRQGARPGSRADDLGFRLVRTLKR